MLDLKTFSRSLKFTWIQKYLSSQSDTKWKTFFDYRLKRYSDPFLFSCNIRKEDIKHLNTPDQFTNEILELWAEVHSTEKDNQNQNSMKEQILWNNSYTRIENKPVYYNNWVVNGMLNIKQLQDTQGKFLDNNRFKESFKNIKTNFLEHTYKLYRQ